MQDDTSNTLTHDSIFPAPDADPDCPALVMIFSAFQPVFRVTPLGERPVTIGRHVEAEIPTNDLRMSRKHVELWLANGCLNIRDLGSHNGTTVDGSRIEHASFAELPRTLRVGDTVFLIVERIEPFLGREMQLHCGGVIGPTLAVAHERLIRIAQSDRPALITGPSGVGKELATRYFHSSGPRANGPLVAVNCATIPSTLAERLLFGAQRGAYSGADVHAEGYLQAADGGTLFLDEIAELELTVQAKLLRVLETREVLPLGATKPRRLQLSFCGATLKDLSAEVAAGRFRDDLYYRIGQPEVRIPALYERGEEIPWIADRELKRMGDAPALTASFIEACLMRMWPGNVRELIQQVHEAVSRAKAAQRSLLHASDLTTLDAPAAPRAALSTEAHEVNEGESALQEHVECVEREQILKALAACNGNRKMAAKRLGIARNTLASRIQRFGIDVSRIKA